MTGKIQADGRYNKGNLHNMQRGMTVLKVVFYSENQRN